MQRSQLSLRHIDSGSIPGRIEQLSDLKAVRIDKKTNIKN